MTTRTAAVDPQGVDRRALPERLAGPLGVAAAVAAAALALHLRDPHRPGAWGACPSLAWFGVACPLCGGLRAVNDLTMGRFGDAFWSNALFISALPLFLCWWLWVLRERWRGSLARWDRPFALRGTFPAALAVMAVFTIIRNTPWGARLYP